MFEHEERKEHRSPVVSKSVSPVEVSWGDSLAGSIHH